MIFVPPICDHQCSLTSTKRLRRRPLVEALFLVLGAGSLSAATIAVNSTVDGTLAILAGNGTCDLREAIAAANGNSLVGNCPGDDAGLDTINLAGIAGQTITLSAGQLTINSDVTLQGQGVTIDGNNSVRLFSIGNNATTTLHSLTVQNGTATFNGGGIYVNNATVNLTDSTISGNSARFVSGGGIYANNATVNLTNSTVSGNSARRGGGGIYADNATTVSLTNSTVSGNTAGNRGGGIYANNATVNLTDSTVFGNSARNGGSGIHANNATTVSLTNSTVSGNSTRSGNGGGIVARNVTTVSLTNSTVSGNTARSGNIGGIYANNATVNLTNSILASNVAGSGPDLGGSRSVVNTLFSLIGTDAGSGSLTINQDAGSQVGSPGPIDPLLGPLQNNGGSTETHALLLGSPAIDTGSNALALDPGGSPLSTDQRGTGFPRILDGDGDTTATVDLGALEFPTLQNVNALVGGTLSNQSLNMTPVLPEAPAGIFGFDVNFCNTATGPGNNFSLLFSRTITLSNSNSLVSRSRDGTPPGGAGSEQAFVVGGDYADGILSPSECVIVNYQIGLSTLAQSAFIIDVIGSVQ